MTTQTMNITERAMLARLSITQWTGKKYDKRVSEEVRAAHDAAADAGRYNKSLVSAAALKRVQTAANTAREEHYKYTLPWKDDGARILPAKAYDTYQKTMRRLRADFENAAGEFCDLYPGFVSEARVRLNGMFREEDYPHAEQIAARFTWEVSFEPLPAGNDFRVELDAAQVQQIQDQIDARTRDALADGMKDAWQRLIDVVGHAANTLGKPDAIFRDSLIGNIREVCETLPLLNITDDPNLENARLEVLDRIATYGPDQLRNTPQVRNQVALDAQRIMADMAAYMQ